MDNLSTFFEWFLTFFSATAQLLCFLALGKNDETPPPSLFLLGCPHYTFQEPISLMGESVPQVFGSQQRPEAHLCTRGFSHMQTYNAGIEVPDTSNGAPALESLCSCVDVPQISIETQKPAAWMRLSVKQPPGMCNSTHLQPTFQR